MPRKTKNPPAEGVAERAQEARQAMARDKQRGFDPHRARITLLDANHAVACLQERDGEYIEVRSQGLYLLLTRAQTQFLSALLYDWATSRADLLTAWELHAWPGATYFPAQAP